MTEVGLGGAAIVATGWAGRKLLGPLFDEIAQDWRSRYSASRAENLVRIGKNAEAKLGSAIDEEGQVPPRVAAKVMEEGSWCDGPVMAEYFGGILAASRSLDPLDDRGSVWAALVSRLSTYDVYLHYLFYEAFRRLHLDSYVESVFLDAVRRTFTIYMPANETLVAMGLTAGSLDFARVVIPSLNSLIREGLIGPMLTFGEREFLSNGHAPDPPDGGFVTVPSPAGMELFMWAHGIGGLHPNAIIESSSHLTVVEDLGTVKGAQTLQMMRDEQNRRSSEPS